MGSYIIKATNLVPETGTVVADAGFYYTDVLNDVNEAEIKISGTSATKRSLLVIGSEIEISRDGTMEFLGFIDDIDYFEGGTVVFHASGYEIWLAKENGDYANSPWQSIASATIFNDILIESNYLSVGTIEAGFAIYFRLSTSQSLWNGITNLAKKTTQDIQVDYVTKEIDILDHRGSATSVGTFNDNISIKNVRVNFAYPLGNHILVFGKGDGINQIKGTAEDAASIAAYGRIKRTIIDLSIISTGEANKLAIAELALMKDPPKIIDFEFVNPNENVSTGDIITLNAEELSEEEVRIVGLERGVRGNNEYLTAQVTNPALKQLMKTRNKILGQLKKEQIDEGSYMQGSTVINTWGAGINAKTDYPLKVGFYVSAGFKDEANNLQINSIEVDYDIDPYNQQYGTASFDGTDPQVQNTSGDTEPDVENSSGSTAPSVSGTSSNTLLTSDQGIDTFAENVTTSWDLILGEAISGTFSFVYVDIEIEHDAWSGNDTFGIEIQLGAEVKVTDLDLTYSSVYGPFKKTYVVPIFASTTGTINVYMYSAGNNDYKGGLHVYGTDETHSHGDGSYAAANHGHTDGTYNAADHGHPDGSYDINSADLDNISIGDGVSEGASVNATSVTIYLDYFENKAITNNEGSGAGVVIEMADTGTITAGDVVYFDGRVSGNAEWATVASVVPNVSITCTIATNKSAGDFVTWTNKHSVVNAATIDEEIDISDSSTYPDVFGYWRIRIDPNSANSDFIQGIVRLKFHIDS